MPETHVIDLSHWNVVDSFADIKTAGVVGIIHKCTEGTTYLDPTYHERMEHARRAGLEWGAYHFLRHENAWDQMEHFVGKHHLPPGSRLAIDYEDPACVLHDLETALQALKELDPTQQVCVYSGHLLKEQVGNKMIPWLKPYSLWLAQYTSGTPTWPKQIWPYWSLWQFTDSGHQEGVAGECDLDTFNGDTEQCKAWFSAPVSAGVSEPQVVKIDIQCPQGVQLQMSINGRMVTGD